jgi:hypothetical protein
LGFSALSHAAISPLFLAAPLFALQTAIPAPPRAPDTPRAVAQAAVLEDGRVHITSPWAVYHPPFTDGGVALYFDAFEAGADGVPTGFCTSGCNQAGYCPGTPESYRWWLGASFRNPFAVNDFTVTPGAAAMHATCAQFAWMWGETQPTRCLVAVLTADAYQDCTVGLPEWSGPLGGVVMDFGDLGGGPGSYHWSSVTLDAGLSWLMPTTGSGAYAIILANSQDESGALAIDTAWGTQPMLWGCGDGETPPSSRPGHQGPTQWDDWNPTDGVHEPGECSYYFDNNKCPRPYGAMLAFSGPQLCYPNCDNSSAPPALNVADFTCFLQKFAQDDPYANCDGSTAAPILNVNDFTCFLQRFAQGCP